MPVCNIIHAFYDYTIGVTYLHDGARGEQHAFAGLFLRLPVCPRLTVLVAGRCRSHAKSVQVRLLVKRIERDAAKIGQLKTNCHSYLSSYCAIHIYRGLI